MMRERSVARHDAESNTLYEYDKKRSNKENLKILAVEQRWRRAEVLPCLSSSAFIIPGSLGWLRMLNG